MRLYPMRSIIFIIVSSWLWLSCEPQEDSFSFDPGLTLIFSGDTVTFDTLISNRRSSTRRLTVYNPNEESVLFGNIFLGRGDQSDYSVIINGRPQTTLQNEPLFAGDSLLILVEVNVDPRDEDLPYLVKDSIVFTWNGNSADVKLISYGQDGREIGTEVICDEIWTSDRPYIISDTLIVSPNCNLQIEKGTQIYFENNAAIFVQGSLKVSGDSANHVVFRNARFDGIYDEVPGQWNGIYFLVGSKNNEVLFADIFNAQVGLRVGTPDSDSIPDVVVANTRIFNMSAAGILGFTSDISVTNTLVYNCGQYLVGGFAGGNYSFDHCTFANIPPLFIQDQPTVQFSDNLVLTADSLLVDDLFLQLRNSIIWGSQSEEFLLSAAGGQAVVANIQNNILRTELDISNNFISQEFNFPGFSDVFSNDYSLDTLAFAQDKGLNLGITRDITGAKRNGPPDIGAFERQD